MHLMGLKSLRWLAVAGNPFLNRLEVHFDDAAAEMMDVNSEDMGDDCGTVLGEGASG